MSIILEALRRAERERGQRLSPGADTPAPPDAAPPLPAAPAPSPAAPGGLPRWTWPLLLGVLLLTALAGWLRQRLAPTAEAPPPPPPRQAVAEPVPAPAALPPPPVAAPQTPVAAPRPQPPVAASVPATAMRLDAESAPVRPTARALPRYQDLPEATRRAFPALRVGGSMYSDSPSASVLVVNDQLLREGDSVVPGLLIEQIGPRSARLRWQDQAFTLPYADGR
jgi:general secretion pathway protein B